MKSISPAVVAILLAYPLASQATAPVPPTPIVEVACNPATGAQAAACAVGAAVVIAVVTDPKAVGKAAEEVVRNPYKAVAKPIKKLGL